MINDMEVAPGLYARKQAVSLTNCEQFIRVFSPDSLEGHQFIRDSREMAVHKRFTRHGQTAFRAFYEGGILLITYLYIK